MKNLPQPTEHRQLAIDAALSESEIEALLFPDDSTGADFDIQKSCQANRRWRPGRDRMRQLRRYTSRLAEIFKLHEAGLSNREAGRRLGCTEGTIRYHLGHGRGRMAALVEYLTRLPRRAVRKCVMPFSAVRPAKLKRALRVEWWLSKDHRRWIPYWYRGGECIAGGVLE